MIVPYIDLGRQYAELKPEILEAVDRVMSSGRYVGGEEVERFEENIAKYMGVKHVIAVNSGTDALALSIMSSDIEANKRVITVSHTAISTIATILLCQCDVILVDIDEDMNIIVPDTNLTPDPESDVVGFVPVHLNGRMCKMDRINSIAEMDEMTVIEDACQAFGARYKGKLAGTYGLCGCFSLHPLKVLSAAGDGGFIVTDDDDIATHLRYLRNHGGDIMLGFNSRLDAVQAAILNVKLKYIDKWIEKRREIARMYDSGLRKLPQLTLPPPPGNGDFYDVYTSYVIRATARDSLALCLAAIGIETQIHWDPPHHHKNIFIAEPPFSIELARLDNTNRICKEVLSLPCYPELTDDEIEYVIEAIKDFYGT